MPWTDYDSQVCSLARTMPIIGERWAMLILRDVFRGVRRFEELQTHLGAPRDILTRRLKTLTEAGVLERVPYKEAGSRTRYEYRPTTAGHELRPALQALVDWGDKHLSGPEGPPMRMEHEGCGAAVHSRQVCEEGHVLTPDDRVRTTMLPGARLLEA
jgi:DNA-binding HxlR family transcriptional regulator